MAEEKKATAKKEAEVDQLKRALERIEALEKKQSIFEESLNTLILRVRKWTGK